MSKARRSPRTKMVENVFAGIVVLVALALGVWIYLWAEVHPPRSPKTQANATALLQAIEGYYLEYERLPDFGAKGDEVRTEGKDGNQLLTILLGREEVSDSMQNKKQIRFLNADETKTKNKGGLLFSEGGADAAPEGLYDAWGNAFHLRFDQDNDQEIENPLMIGNVVRNKIVIIYSFGADGKPGTKDDVKSW